MLGCWVSWEVQSLNNESHVTKRTTDTAWLHYTTWTMISAVESIINITRFHQRKCCTLLYTWYSYTTCRADWTITFFHHLCFRWTKHRAEASVSPPPLHCPEHALQKLATWKKKKKKLCMGGCSDNLRAHWSGEYYAMMRIHKHYYLFMALSHIIEIANRKQMVTHGNEH